MWKSIAFAAIAAGIVARLFSVGWNAKIIHGDIQVDASAAVSLVRYGQFLTFEAGQDVADVSLGRPLAVHGPLWPMLGAILLNDDIEGAYFALQALSFIGGLALIALTFLLTRRLLDEERAWIAAGLVSISAILIDYSGNGSLYAAQGVLTLLWALVAVAHPRRGALWLGVISGVALLLNLQCIIFFAATAILLLLSEKSLTKGIRRAIVPILVGLIVASPWLVRNVLLSGSPFFSSISNIYLYSKAGIDPGADGLYHIGSTELIRIITLSLTTWFPNNLYYVARKLLILAPVLSIIAMYGFIDVLFSRERFRKLLPIFIILGFHVLLSTAWPVTKFRYFVPLLPFVFILGLEALPKKFRDVTVGATIIIMLFFAYLTYQSTPTHTYYYDGAITQDPFHGKGELEYVTGASPDAQ